MPFTRKTNRLPHKPLYQGNNWYFITICTANRKCIFVEENLDSPYSPGGYVDGEINFSATGHGQLKLSATDIVHQTWYSLREVFTNITLDEFVIMPNHIHGIIGFEGTPKSKFTDKPTDLSKIIKYFKSKSTIEIKKLGQFGQLKLSATIEKYETIWQKSFYDNVIRDEKDLQRVREYIQNNPLQWELDALNPINKNLDN
jgi:putative transposase